MAKPQWKESQPLEPSLLCAGQTTTTFQGAVAKPETKRGKETNAPQAQTKGCVEKVAVERASPRKQAEQCLQAMGTLVMPNQHQFPETI